MKSKQTLCMCGDDRANADAEIYHRLGIGYMLLFRPCSTDVEVSSVRTDEGKEQKT